MNQKTVSLLLAVFTAIQVPVFGAGMDKETVLAFQNTNRAFEQFKANRVSATLNMGGPGSRTGEGLELRETYRVTLSLSAEPNSLTDVENNIFGNNLMYRHRFIRIERYQVANSDLYIKSEANKGLALGAGLGSIIGFITGVALTDSFKKFRWIGLTCAAYTGAAAFFVRQMYIWQARETNSVYITHAPEEISQPIKGVR